MCLLGLESPTNAGCLLGRVAGNWVVSPLPDLTSLTKKYFRANKAGRRYLQKNADGIKCLWKYYSSNYFLYSLSGRLYFYYCPIVSINQTESQRFRPVIRRVAAVTANRLSYGLVVLEPHAVRSHQCGFPSRNSRASRKRRVKVDSDGGEGGEQPIKVLRIMLGGTRPARGHFVVTRGRVYSRNPL